MRILERLFWHMKNEKHLLRWAVSRCLFYTGTGRFFTVKCGLYKIRFFPSALSLTKWLNPGYENNDEHFLRRILRPKDTVIDVGANIGTISLAAAALVGIEGRVIAFEPNPRVFKYLKKNIQLNKFDNMTTLNLAVGAKPGELPFSDLRCDDQNKISLGGKCLVHVTTLDEQLASIKGRIKLLKVDVEGYEKFVFMGGTETLARTDYVYFEVHEPHFMPFMYTTCELLQMLNILGFRFYRIDDVGKEISIDSSYIPENCMNVIGKRMDN